MMRNLFRRFQAKKVRCFASVLRYGGVYQHVRGDKSFVSDEPVNNNNFKQHAFANRFKSVCMPRNVILAMPMPAKYSFFAVSSLPLTNRVLLIMVRRYQKVEGTGPAWKSCGIARSRAGFA